MSLFIRRAPSQITMNSTQPAKEQYQPFSFFLCVHCCPREARGYLLVIFTCQRLQQIAGLKDTFASLNFDCMFLRLLGEEGENITERLYL